MFSIVLPFFGLAAVVMSLTVGLNLVTAAIIGSGRV